jgi:hypothetical protein
MGFKPIDIDTFVQSYLEHNRGENAKAVKSLLQAAMKAYQSGAL